MSHRKFSLPSSWANYSKKLISKIERPRHAGAFSIEEAKARGMRLAIGHGGDCLRLFLLVDELDGVIADVKFRLLGPPALIGAVEMACELLMRKNYHQASNMGAEMIDMALRDKVEIPTFSEEMNAYLNWIIDAIQMAAEQCLDIPFAEHVYVPTPLEPHLMEGEGYPGWVELDRAAKIHVIEQVISDDVRPYIELDAGGVQIVDFINEQELIIAYQGACTSCFSATGATLNAIQEILRAKVHPSIRVTPDMSVLIRQNGID